MASKILPSAAVEANYNMRFTVQDQWRF